MTNKMGIIAVSLSILTIGGGALYVNNNKEIPVNAKVKSTQGTSEMLKEELAIKGKIDKVEVTKEGTVITVGDVKILLHASTNIFEDKSLLKITDLKEGQIVEVYSDGVKGDILNGLRVEVLNKQETSEMLKEELAIKGKIDKIEVSEEGSIITVGDIKISVHASTNIFKGDSLLNIDDLKEGQNIEVYSDGIKGDILNGLRVELIN
ncbi:MAG: DUF5666 domain-containing protein [Paraclostridium sp.]